jgi:catechol 2,3-dioxygenase-like lactoylglutathione lyase family enzyme
MSAFRIKRMAAALLFAFALAASPSNATTTVLGEGRGIDHVGIAVRDLDRATADFKRLGFDIRSGGRFPGALSNALCYFSDWFYLEFLAVAPNYTKDSADVANFARKHEGAMFLGLHTSSAKDTVEHLRARGFDIAGPDPGSIMTGNETKPPPPEWYSAYTPDKPAPGKKVIMPLIFFIQYLESSRKATKGRESRYDQPNTATRVRGVWFAVDDLAAQHRSLRDAGFAASVADVTLLGLRGKSVPAARGNLNLLQSKGPIGPVGAHEDGIVAVSIEVKDLAKAHAMARAATKLPLPIYSGAFGKSFLIPSGAAHGVAIEMVQG